MTPSKARIRAQSWLDWYFSGEGADSESSLTAAFEGHAEASARERTESQAARIAELEAKVAADARTVAKMREALRVIRGWSWNREEIMFVDAALAPDDVGATVAPTPDP